MINTASSTSKAAVAGKTSISEKTLDSLLVLGEVETIQKRLLRSLATFTLRGDIIEHTKFTAAIREIARRHHRGLRSRVAEGMLLVAQTGSGKSTILEYYEEKFPKKRTAARLHIPVLRVDTPESPTVKMLAEAILFSMSDPAASKGTTTAKTNRIAHLFKECGVELLMIDEFQHFVDGRRTTESRRVTDWLKNLITKVNIPVILSGLPRAISVLNSNPQLRRRFGAPHYMKPFGYTTTSEMKEFRGVLAGIKEIIPCPCVDISEANIARCFYFATHGLFDYVVKIVDDAVSRGGTGPDGQVTQHDLATAFKRTVWMDAPAELNPFDGMTNFRLLTKPMEPFDIWDDISQYTKSTPLVNTRTNSTIKEEVLK